MLIACGSPGDTVLTNMRDGFKDLSEIDNVYQCFEHCITWNKSHAPPDICHTVLYVASVPGVCNLANATYPGQDIGNGFDNRTDIAFGFLLDESGNIVQQ